MVHLPSLYFLLEDKAPTRVNNARVSASIPEESTNTDSSCCFFRLILCSFFIRKVQVLTSTDSGSCFVGSSDRSALIIAIKLMITSKGTAEKAAVFPSYQNLVKWRGVVNFSTSIDEKVALAFFFISIFFNVVDTAGLFIVFLVFPLDSKRPEAIRIRYLNQASRFDYFPPKIHSP